MPPICPLFLFPTSPSSFLDISLERTTAPSFPLSLGRGIWKTGSVSASLHHIQSSRCLFSAPTLSTVPQRPLLPPLVPPAFLSSPAMSQLLNTASLITVLDLSISISLQLFSSSPSCLCSTPLPHPFPLCLRVFLSQKMGTLDCCPSRSLAQLV